MWLGLVKRLVKLLLILRFPLEAGISKGNLVLCAIKYLLLVKNIFPVAYYFRLVLCVCEVI